MRLLQRKRPKFTTILPEISANTRKLLGRAVADKERSVIFFLDFKLRTARLGAAIELLPIQPEPRSEAMIGQG